MEILYDSDTVYCELNNNIVYIRMKHDFFEKNDVEPIEKELNKLFIFENNKPYLFSFIFDLNGLSYGTLYKYSKVFSNFFLSNRENWKIHQQVAVCITDKTFLKVIVTPFVKLANTGKPFAFKSTLKDAHEFINQKIIDYNFDLNFSEVSPNTTDTTNTAMDANTTNNTTDIDLDEMLSNYEK